jgi:hypothetical protein
MPVQPRLLVLLALKVLSRTKEWRRPAKLALVVSSKVLAVKLIVITACLVSSLMKATALSVQPLALLAKLAPILQPTVPMFAKPALPV